MAQWWEHSPPSNVARASNPGVDAIMWVTLSLAPRRIPSAVFPLSLKTDTQLSIWKARTRLNEFLTTPKCFVANKSQFTTFYDRYYGRIVQESLSEKTKQRKFHFKKFQKSAMKHDTFVRKRQRQAFVRFYTILWYWQPCSYHQILRDLQLPKSIWPCSIVESDSVNWNSCTNKELMLKQ